MCSRVSGQSAASIFCLKFAPNNKRLSLAGHFTRSCSHAGEHQQKRSTTWTDKKDADRIIRFKAVARAELEHSVVWRHERYMISEMKNNKNDYKNSNSQQQQPQRKREGPGESRG